MDQKENESLAPRSPSTEKRIIEHKINVEDRKYADEWASCCCPAGKTDRRLLEFVARAFISTTTLVFSFYQLIKANECDPLVPFYSSLVTFILGLHFNNSPTIKKK